TIFLLYGRPESALAFLRRAQEIDIRNAIVNLNIVSALIEKDDFKSASSLLGKILHDVPGLQVANYFMGRLYYAQRKYAVSEQSLRRATEGDPGLLDAWLLLFHASLDQKKYDQARESLMHIRSWANNQMVAEFIDEQLARLGT